MEVIDIVLLLTGIMLFCYWLNYAMGDPLGKEQVEPPTPAAPEPTKDNTNGN